MGRGWGCWVGAILEVTHSAVLCVLPHRTASSDLLPPPVVLQKKPLPPLPVPQPPMECGVAGVAGSLAGSHGPHGSPAPSPLLSASPMGGPRAAERAERSPAKHGLHVNFTEKVEVKERREKFLTAKYGSHQMALIRKRLAVEMWLFDELQKLYESSVSFGGDRVRKVPSGTLFYALFSLSGPGRGVAWRGRVESGVGKARKAAAAAVT